VFVSLANLDLERAARRLELWGDDQLIEVRDAPLEAQSRADVIVDDIPRDVRTVEVRLVGSDPSVATSPDQLALDDRAWAVIPPDRVREILVVGPGDPYLETALGLLPKTRIFGLQPDEYPAKAVRSDGTPWDLIIFESTLPATLPKTPILAIAPPRTSDLGQVVGTLKNPGIGTLDPQEPVLRFVDLSATHISEASQLTAPAWARTIIPGPRGAPLLYSGIRDGLPSAVLAFEPRRSDLPLEVAFPILMANLTGELLGATTAPTEAVDPGTPVQLVIPSGASGLSVQAPDGTVTELVPGTSGGGGAVTYAGTDLLGVYTATPIIDPDASAAPPASAGSSPVSAPSASPSATTGGAAGSSGSASASPLPPQDPFAPVRFAVDLFDVDESTIAPGSAAAIEALGTTAVASPAPGEGTSTPAATARPTTRDELWVPIVLLVLVFLCVEWALYHRDGLIRIRRSVTGRLRRNAGGTT
jgi:hypothetical protein